MPHDIPKTGYQPNLQRWFDWILGDHDDAGLIEQLHEDVVFISPVVHTPQHGQNLTFAYISAAGKTLGNQSFRYTRVFDCDDKAVLEFETEMNGIQVNGVDIIEWDETGLITEFKVMLRPLKAVSMVHQQMGEMLEKMKSTAKG